MFNLIIGGEPSVFDRWPSMDPNIKNGEDSFSLSRMLEGTPSLLYKKLTPVSPITLAALSKLPVLFMTEIYDKEGDKNRYLRVRLGKIGNLHIDNDDVCYHFEIVHDFGEIKNPEIKQYKEILDLGAYGLSRTHWAVKDKKLRETLLKLELNKTKNDTTEKILSNTSKIGNIKRTSKIRKIKSLKEYISFIEKSNNSNSEIFYRGHSRNKYELIPSLFRKHDNGTHKHLDSESSMVREILSARPNEFISDNFTIDKLVRMQHYGLPTRLLDITSNPLIALYFACCEDPEDTGQVISFPTERKNIKYFDSDTVSCIANLAFMPHNILSTISKSLIENDKSHAKELLNKLLDHIQAEKPYFKKNIDLHDLRKILFIRARINNERIQSQSGAFLLFGHEAVLPETTEDFPLERVDIINKKIILKELAQLNITESTVYPSIEKTASEIAKKYMSDI
ncbi:FRG domain-containing protein [Escherichia coli]|uniref:FRG domain-containing protein n=1 Tax=Escherichia coli TaxID=562 RepID=UPI00157AC955|nr:FRG domain-containing protein [Escherichia coli]EFB9799833.1 FRG domain-containing protein [Escherichia coli]EIC1769783.1 FRG domain-containing protein [Escherichia coli]EIC1906535.1 FRG domain-containing protein [Escherichia coli]EIC1995240.1 FRG domain-containing protein [Escherichia coli]EJM1701794.1 FRG domain-containing protein [Escherichia coli]